MTKNGILVSAWCFLFISIFTVRAVDMQVQAHDHARVKLLICCMGKKNQEVGRVCERIKKDLSFTKQFAVAVNHVFSLTQRGDVRKFFRAGFPLVLFLSEGKGGVLEWRLYDAEHAIMLAGKQYQKRGRSIELWGHHIADVVWPVLTGQPGPFSTKIAYCKEIRRTGKKVLKHIYVADYDGGNEKLLVSMPTVSVAPRWNRDPNNPLLFYSEHTNKNVRLVVVDMIGRRKVVSNFDGINMLPAFSQDGQKVVFCASRGGGNCQLYYYEKGIFKKLTHNLGNNIAPTFCKDGQALFFCSDFETRGPQIYWYEFKTGNIERITRGGYCVSPSYCECNNKLAYAKMVCGTMQVFVYDLKTKRHKQVTADRGNKEEASWSPCGNYLLFAVEMGAQSRLAMLNLISNDCHFVTAKGSICCYPSWSAPYSNFPSV